MRVTTFEVVEDGGLGRVGSRAIDCGDVDAGGAEGSDLVVHQCQEWRDDNSNTVVDNGR